MLWVRRREFFAPEQIAVAVPLRIDVGHLAFRAMVSELVGVKLIIDRPCDKFAALPVKEIGVPIDIHGAGI